MSGPRLRWWALGTRTASLALRGRKLIVFYFKAFASVGCLALTQQQPLEGFMGEAQQAPKAREHRSGSAPRSSATSVPGTCGEVSSVVTFGYQYSSSSRSRSSISSIFFCKRSRRFRDPLSVLVVGHHWARAKKGRQAELTQRARTAVTPRKESVNLRRHRLVAQARTLRGDGAKQAQACTLYRAFICVCVQSAECHPLIPLIFSVF